MFEIFKGKLSSKPLTNGAFVRSYQRHSSISEKLPWAEYDGQHQCFPLDDGRSVAALFELMDVPTEARPEIYLSELQKRLQSIFQDTFPQYFNHESPWILQFYLQDELSLRKYYQQYVDYIKPDIKETTFTQAYLALTKQHIDLLTCPQGLFVDSKISGNIFRGKIRKIRVVIYRKLISSSKLRRDNTAIQDLQIVATTFLAKLESCGIKARRCTGKDFYEWMVPWFNPAPVQGDGRPDKLLERCPYPGDDDMPWGYDFTERLFYSVPQSDHEEGVWYFDGKPHRYITILGLNALPKTGHLTLERPFGNYSYSLFDKFPEGSIFQMTVVIQSQEMVKNHLLRIENSARHSKNTESEMAKEDCSKAKRAMENGNYFFPTVIGVYIRGNDLSDLYAKSTEVEILLSSHGLHTITGDMELTPVDAYLRYLPMCYSPEFDKYRTLRSRYLSGVQLAKLIPLYGRERGTEHPAITFFNRCGEPFTLDPFNPKDKDFNSHLLVLGTTGSGKSATCVSLLMQAMAVYRPRLVIIDVGDSFKLLGEYFKSLGLSVNRVEISFQQAMSLNPFADSSKMLAQLRIKESHSLSSIVEETANQIQASITSLNLTVPENDQENGENRDYLGEMLLAAQLMITGGESKEEAAITREDRYWILKAIVMAAQTAERDKRDQMIASDIVNAFYTLTEELEAKNKTTEIDIIKRLKKMAANLNLFCQDSLSSKYFNEPGHPWPEVDVTILEMGIFKDEGYEAQRALAYLGALNKTMSLAEQHQYEERFTIFYCDEVHNFTKYPPMMLATTKCAKTSRKYAMWLWLATQNIADFPDEARKMLSMMEFWLCLGTSEAELAEIERFKAFTEEERCLFRSVRKEARKYVEGVLLCNRFKGLFRNIPPRLSLVLAMTEKSEKAERKKIMEQQNCTEIEAAIFIAKKMTQ
ncbi:MAG TPA: conjugative transfer ATPase [Gammaproteobacteria bacterium]|jgi:conjugative transfer ATPase|nr:conjugative transfer ATPase [Gammaproteobacteria bacterium]